MNSNDPIAPTALRVVKIGGSLFNDPTSFNRFVSEFAAGSDRGTILVHGGGPQAGELAERLGVEAVMVEGRRVTDSETIDLVTMVYAGLNSKRLVAELQSKGCNALGLSGADGGILRAVKRPVREVDFGFVGDIVPDDVNVEQLWEFMQSGLVPVLNAITHDGAGQLLNTNADTIAGTVASAFARRGKSDTSGITTELLLIMDRPGILLDAENDASIISNLTTDDLERLTREERVSRGMLPKIQNGIEALRNGVTSVRVGSIAMLNDATAGSSIRLS